MTRYNNPWVKSSEFKNEFYSTNVKPTEYKTCLIYERVPHCFDVVKNGICLSQRAGLNGAKLVADVLENIENPLPEMVGNLMMKAYGHL